MQLDKELKTLNDSQLKAVQHSGSPLLILAGAGAGKTKVITTKIAYLINNGIAAYKILAVTFTNKAAREMQERATLLVPESTQSSIKTFHSFGAWFLRRFYSGDELAENFTIYDDTDSATLLSTCFQGIDKQIIKKWQQTISRAKDDFILPEDIDAESPYAKIKQQYSAYQKKLRETGNVDFGDLIMLPALCLKQNPEIKKHLQNYFKVILVDEFQDTNTAQMELLKELVSEKMYLCVVGDDDQSIYKFRGASVSNILNFKNIFPKTKIIKLEKNYRSTPQILDVANSIIKNNEERLGKTLQPVRRAGIKPILFFEANQTMEAERVIELIYEDVIVNKNNYSDWAILYRTNYQSRNFETAFLKEHIPYKVIGSLRFFEREEIKDAIAFLRFVLNLKDEVSFRRIINKPARGIGSVSKVKILNAMTAKPNLSTAALQLSFVDETIFNEKNSSDDKNYLQNILVNLKSSTLTKKTRAEAEKFFKNIFYLRKVLKEKSFANENKTEGKKYNLLFSSGLSEFVAKALEISGLTEYYYNQDEISDSQKIGNLQELVTMALPFSFDNEGLNNFLETISLDATTTQAEEDNNFVSLITVHGTKGLEFDNVVITGLEENIFPINRKNSFTDIEEERRLMYVACTRARNRLFMTAVQNRMWAGRSTEMELSRFVKEINEDLFVVKNFANIYSTSFTKLKKTVHSFPKTIKPAQKNKEEHNTKWKKGVIVFSNDAGFGKITRSEIIDGELVIEVKFESGERKVFFPAYNVASLEIVQGN
ncbi:MAG: ATP-dependent helicase [Treponemataceae bacterium]